MIIRKAILSFILICSIIAFTTSLNARESERRENVEAIVEVFNNFIVSVRLGFSFECLNPESDAPVLRCFIGQTRAHCIKKMIKLEFIAHCISVDWAIYTGNSEIELLDLEKEIVFLINSKGKFISITML